MAQPEFLLNARVAARLFQTSTIRATHPEIRKVRYHSLAGMRIGHSVGTGRIDRKKIDISSPDASSFVFRIAATAEAIKAVLRRIRPQEAEVLDAIDRDIADVQSRLNALKDRRQDALRTAWQRAHVVRLAEIEQLLPTATAPKHA